MATALPSRADGASSMPVPVPAPRSLRLLERAPAPLRSRPPPPAWHVRLGSRLGHWVDRLLTA